MKSGKKIVLVLAAVFLLQGCTGPSKKTSESASMGGNHTITYKVHVGDYYLGMSRDVVLKKHGKPQRIFYHGETFTLKNLPEKYYMEYEDLSFLISGDLVEEITLLSPLYKLPSGLKIGDSEEEMKKAYGDDFNLSEGETKNYFEYKKYGLVFEVDKDSKTIMEINITDIEEYGQ